MSRAISQAVDIAKRVVMGELSSTVKHNADSVHPASQLVDTMKGINDIISVIDGIAFQTNILALNAALVEESAAAASSLNSQVQQLLQSVAAFKLGTGS